MTDLGRYIRQRRVELDLSQRQLGLLSDVSNTEIKRIEDGERKQPSQDILRKIASPLRVDPVHLFGLAGYEVKEQAEVPQAVRAVGHVKALADIIRRMFADKHLKTLTAVQVFTGGVLTKEELQDLADGAPPSWFGHDKLVAFFRRFPLEQVRQWYQAAQAPLPQEFEDIVAELRKYIDKVKTSTDGSPEALEFVIQVAKEVFAENGER